MIPLLTLLMHAFSGAQAIAPSAAPTAPPATAQAQGGGWSCNCTTDYVPVCASDMQTYGTDCLRGCANAVLMHTGVCSCPEELNPPNTAVCDGQRFQPVCSHGWTMQNPCQAAQSNYGCGRLGVCEYAPGQTYTPAPLHLPSVYGVAQAAANTTFPATTGQGATYGAALKTGLLYYRVQQSGQLDQQLLAWRTDSCLNCVGPEGQDVSGGFYNGGGSNYWKKASNGAYLVTPLAWSLIAFQDGYSKAGVLQEAEAMLAWGADYLVNSWNYTAQALVALVQNVTLGDLYYGPPEEWPYEQTTWSITREQPGSEVAGEAAAALAASYLAAGESRLDYLQTAEELYLFAVQTNTSILKATDPGLLLHNKGFSSKTFVDELAWAAAWLWKATNESAYLDDTRTYWNQACASDFAWAYGMDDKCPAVSVLLGQIDTSNSTLNAAYKKAAKQYLDIYLTQVVPHTNWGIAYPWQWGSMRPAMSAAWLALTEAQHQGQVLGDVQYAAQLFNYAKYQVDYVLGNITGLSWMSGFGKNPPPYILNKFSHNPSMDWPLRGQDIWMGQDFGPFAPNTTYSELPLIVQASKLEFEGSFVPNRFIPYGALYPSPLENDGRVFGRKDRTYTEITTEGQSPFMGALAALASYYTDTVPYNSCNFDLGWTHLNATLTPRSVNNTAHC